MTNVALCFPNLADSANLSASLTEGSWVNGSMTRLQQRDFSAVARTTDALNASTILQGSLGSTAVPIDCIAIVKHNLGNGAKWKIKLGTTAGGAEVLDTGWMDCWQITARGSRYPVAWAPGVSFTARYFRIEFDDDANSDGYVEMGRLFIGRSMQLEQNAVRDGFGLRFGDLSEVQTMQSGAEQFARADIAREYTFEMPVLTDAEGDSVADLMLSAGITGELFWCPFPGRADKVQRYGFIGRFRELTTIEWPYSYYRKAAFAVKESI
jgi:hypothetical protein